MSSTAVESVSVELLALRVLDALRLPLREVPQGAEEVLGVAAEGEEAAASALHALSVPAALVPPSRGELRPVAGLHLALQLGHGRLRACSAAENGERRDPVGFALETPRGRADLVEPGRRRHLWRLAEHDPERAGGRLGLLDPRGGLRLAHLHEPRDERIDVAPTRRVGRDLAERSDRPASRSAALLVTGDTSARTASQLRRPSPPSKAQRYARSPSRGSVATTALTASAGPACAAARPAMRSRSSASATSPQYGPMSSVDARELFSPLGPTYDRVGAALSLGQDPRWRRFLVSRFGRRRRRPRRRDEEFGLVAAELLRRGFRVTGSTRARMLAVARRRFGDRVPLVEASAEALPFAGGSFHLTFTYLLRYVDDPGATLVELARVVRPGGVLASLEFGVPGSLARPACGLYVELVLPLAG